MIRIYEPEEHLFQNNGLGNVDTLSCIETKKAGLNGWQIDVIVHTKYADLIKQDYLAVAETKEYGAQPFRIENPRVENRQIRFTARHVIFEAEKYVLLDSRPTDLGAVQYVNWVNSMTDKPSPFTVSGNFTGKTGTNYFVRKTLMDALLQAEQTFGCIIDPYRFQIRVMMPESVGSDNGYSIVYGKNLQGITVQEEWKDVCTKILPVGPEGLLLENPYMFADVQYDRPYTKVVSFNFNTREDDGTDLTIGEQRTVLAQMAQAYLDEHKYPKVSYTVKSDVPQELKIRDIVHVKHPMLTIDARVTEYKYDCISHKVKSLTFGNYDTSNKSALDSRIESVSGYMIDDTSSMISRNQISRYDAGLQKLIDTMANAMGLFKTEVVSANGGVIYYYHDRPIMSESSVVYTFNDSGFVVSTDGGQTYNAGFDVHGNAVVNVLSAIGLSADWVETGKLEVKKGIKTIFLADYDTGVVKIVADEFSLSDGKTISDIAYEEISNFAETVINPDLQDLQNQIDEKIITWYKQGVPTLSNNPAVGWTDTATKDKHIGDLYYDTDTGKSYIFEKSGNTYSWNLITDSRITDALANASAAQDTADGKRRVFVAQPTPPYDIGDLWVQGTSGDIMRCSTARSSGSYAASDWVKASKYTDDTALNSFLTGTYMTDKSALQGQIDGKAETWYQTTDPSSAWTTSDLKTAHSGDLWYNSTSSVQKYYRWNGTSWEELTATPPDDVFDQIDGKAQIFVSQPVPPYNVGDLWVQGASGDIMRCSTARSSGSYAASDWVKASKYTDDTAVTNLDSSLTQSEIFNRLTSNGTIQGLFMQNGQLYVNGSYISATDLYAICASLAGFQIDSTGMHTKNVAITSNASNSIGMSPASFKRTVAGEERTLKFALGSKFGVAQDGSSYMSGAYLYGGKMYQEGSSNAWFSIENGQVSGGYKNEGTQYIDFTNRNSNIPRLGIWAHEALEIIANGGFSIGAGDSGGGFAQTPLIQYFTEACKAMSRYSGQSGNLYGSIMFGEPSKFYKNVQMYGTLSVTGTKSRKVETPDYAGRLLYCYEMPSPIFGDTGEGKLDEEGVCYIGIDDILSETISAKIEYQVFLQKEGPGDIWVDEKKPNYFCVKGTPNLKFAWELKAKQKGYEYERLEDADTLEYEEDNSIASAYADDIKAMLDEAKGDIYYD